MKKMNLRSGMYEFFLASAIFFSLFIFLLSTTFAAQSGSSGAASLSISDETDTLVHYTVCTGYCGPKIKDILSQQNVIFYANFTNSSGSVVNASNGNGNVTIMFNENGSWTSSQQMIYNSTSFLWEFTKNFTYRGTLNSSINATSSFGNVTLYESVFITNTPPYIVKDTGGFVSFDGGLTNGILQCTEDSLCTYNFSANVSEDDRNDVLVFNYSSANTSLSNFLLNSSSGLLIINYTTTDQIGSNLSSLKQIELTVKDSQSPIIAAILQVNITAENDAPYFLNLEGNRVVNKSGIVLLLAATDEESDLDYTFNVSFPSCVHTALNPPTGANNCTLFNLTSYNSTATNITFVPQGNQKGIYVVNFSVIDSRGAQSSTLVNWTVSWNDPPTFTYFCNNERTATEDSPFSCYINASDPDELYNLTFTANYTWLIFNSSLTNSATLNTSSGNASALLNFTPNDTAVGNWSVNISVIDTGAENASIETNSTTFYFFVSNVNDSVFLFPIADRTAYNSTIYSFTINATDDDLLVPDKSVMNETLTFVSNNTAVNISTPVYFAGTNRSQATVSFNPNSLGAGAHIINITVYDRNNNSADSDTFTITVVSNEAPVWLNPSTNITMTENVQTYLNFSQNVSDTDDLNFTLTTLSDFQFEGTINEDTGELNFTPSDDDVGTYEVRITADDGKTPSSQEFNFTVNNVNDVPAFFQLVVLNGTYSSGMINLKEDNRSQIQLQLTDDDLLIEQTDFFSESFTVNLTISGPNSSLFSLVDGELLVSNRYLYRSAFFSPRKADVGSYNVTVNITDEGGLSFLQTFNLTVTASPHNPNLTTDVDNVVLSVLNETFYIDVNATDLEDGSDGAVTNLTYRLTNLTAGGNFLRINSSTGIINFTSNQSVAGKWEYLLIVNDTVGSEDSDYFNLTIYDYPRFISPNSSYSFNLKENVSSVLNFTVNHTVGDLLNYTLFVNGVQANITSNYGNATTFLWSFAPNFTMETTCSGIVNLTLNASNVKLSNSTSWSVSINHTNYPLRFITNITDQSGGTPVLLTLSNYFEDIDATDICVNDTVRFSSTLVQNSTSGGTISVSFINWTSSEITPLATFSSTSDGSANYSIQALEYNSSGSSLGSISSNNFSVALTVTDTTVNPTTGGGGGGGSTRAQVVSLKILVPEPVSARQQDKLIIPLGIENDGAIDLKRIYLDAVIAKDGIIRNDLVASFDTSFFEKLAVGHRENVTFIVDIDTSSTGLFEVTINATVEDPKYTDWTKFYIEIEEERDVLEKILFTEEFIIGNPRCAELVDLTNEARSLYEEERIVEALAKTESALIACNRAITQPPSPRFSPISGNSFLGYTALASLFAFVLGFAYYTYKRVSLNRKIQREIGKFNNAFEFSGSQKRENVT